MKRLFFVLSTVLFFSCVEEVLVRYNQFTSDDLAHLYYDKDTLTYKGQVIDFTDTIYFLLNSKDTIVVPVKTRIISSKSDWAMFNVEDVYGSSKIQFEPSTGFEWLKVYVSRFDDPTKGSLKIFDIGLTNRTIDSFKDTIHIEDTIQMLDTAQVLSKIYLDVYKFYLPIENNYSCVKAVYFAKKFGYIKIEGIDGKKLELIKICSKDTI